MYCRTAPRQCFFLACDGPPARVASAGHGNVVEACCSTSVCTDKSVAQGGAVADCIVTISLTHIHVTPINLPRAQRPADSREFSKSWRREDRICGKRYMGNMK